MEMMLVKSPNGKGLHLTDSTVRDKKGEFYHCSISDAEAKKGKTVEVPSNETFHGYIKLGYLALATSNPEKKPVEKKAPATGRGTVNEK